MGATPKKSMSLLREIRKVAFKALVPTFVVAVLVNGFATNFYQLLCRIFIAPISRVAYHKVTAFGVCGIGRIFIWFLEWGGDVRIRVFSDISLEEIQRPESAIIVANHVNSYDWLAIAWMIDCFGFLQNLRALAKRSLAWVPVMGWTWIFCDFIFLHRDMKSDKRKIQKGVSNLVNASKGDLAGRVPFMACIFPEGTRSSAPKKLEESQEWQRGQGIEPMKHVLYPRTGGLIQIYEGLREEVGAIYDVTVCYPKSCPSPSKLLSGEGMDMCIHVRSVPVKTFADASEKDTLKEEIVEIFRKKDKLLEGYFAGKPLTTDGSKELFPNAPKRLTTLVHSLAINAVAHGMLAAFMWHFSPPMVTTILGTLYAATMVLCVVML